MFRTILAKKLVDYVWHKLKSRVSPTPNEALLDKIDELEDRIEYLEKREEKRKSRLLS